MAQNYGALKITAPTSGAVTVDLTLPVGYRPTVYSDAAVTTTVALPVAVAAGATQIVYFASPATITLSVLYGGVQVADPIQGVTQKIDIGPGQVCVRDYSNLKLSAVDLGTGSRRKGLVCFTWDDGFASHDQIATLAASLGQRHTFGIVSNFPPSGNSTYATITQVQRWASLGHEIASHSVDHVAVTGLTPAQRVAEYDTSKSIIEGWVGAGTVKTFIYPFGGASRSALTDHELYLRYDRIVDVGPETIYPIEQRDDFLIRRLTWNDTTTAQQQVLDLINYAATHPVVVSFYTHDVGATGNPSWVNVQAAMNLASSLGVQCVTLAEGFPAGNKMVDGGFEQAGIPNWVPITSDGSQLVEQLADAADVGLNGTNSLHLRTSTNAGVFCYAYQQYQPIMPGLTYRFAARYRVSTTLAGAGGCYLRVREFSYDPQIAPTITQTTALASGTWALATLDYTPTVAARYVYIDFLVNNSQADMYVDHADFRPRGYGNFA